ncbi:hypothetical protein SEA_SAMPSON_53 [Gordonia Phage Sampson]|uniref:Uncharacterized protein n=1 Tax=Gordonia Phage Sampson TaxID=2951393 RepID=A0A9E7SYF9_9CAUD|nr:hypothetical protein SEA_SAMPSON_53 [Gordonia Phage Sampson]
MSTTRSIPRPSNKANCWRLRHTIPGVAAAGMPVLYEGPHPDDPTEHRIIVLRCRTRITVPAYYLNPPARDHWTTPTGQQTA